MEKFLKYAILSIILLNLPSASLKFFSATLGTVMSYGSLLLILIYYIILPKKGKPSLWFIAIGLSYYLISSLQYYDEAKFFVTTSLKYFLVIICGYEVIKGVSKKELFYFLLIGSLSILFHVVFFKSDYGRYSGFYINPNVAGFICISGYGLTYGLEKGKMKLIGQFIFTLMGLLTFSRTFIALWLLLNLLSIIVNPKNVKIFVVGVFILIALFTIDDLIGLDNPRFQQLKSIVYNEQVSTQEIGEDSRTETWAHFYKYILEKPILGNGYGAFQGGGVYVIGSHNSYLLILGESGIVPFLLFTSLFMYMLWKSVFIFKRHPNLLMQGIAISIFLLANHNFFNFYYILFLAMWIYYQIKMKTTPELTSEETKIQAA